MHTLLAKLIGGVGGRTKTNKQTPKLRHTCPGYGVYPDYHFVFCFGCVNLGYGIGFVSFCHALSPSLFLALVLFHVHAFPSLLVLFPASFFLLVLAESLFHDLLFLAAFLLPFPLPEVSFFPTYHLNHNNE